MLYIILYSLLFDYTTPNPQDIWPGILRLAHIWECPNTRRLAFRELDNLPHDVISAFQRVIIARDFVASEEWTQKSLEALADRDDFLTEEEGEELGVKMVLKVTALRDRRRYGKY